MKEQIYIIKEMKTFDLKDIFECGQCFRWNKEEDGSYTGVIKDCVLNVKKETVDKNIVFKGVTLDNKLLEEKVRKYFDLDRNYEKIKEKLNKIDENMRISIKYGSGIRILNQDLWEMIISYIISANNNIPRIKGIIEKLSFNYGNKIIWNKKEYYTFPTAKQLENVQIEDFRKLGLGFRDKRIYETVKMVLEKEVDLEKMPDIEETSKVREEILKLSGVGPKVCDCIVLFSTLKRFDVFPIDVWVRRVMNDLYIKKEDEEKVSKTEIEKIAKEKFGDLKGIAQQYLFYWRREA